jgi:hypothetical protein
MWPSMNLATGLRALRIWLNTIGYLHLAGTQFMSLRFTHSQEEIDALARETDIRAGYRPKALANHGGPANLVCALDLVVCVAAAVVDLCGALGRFIWSRQLGLPIWH